MIKDNFLDFQPTSEILTYRRLFRKATAFEQMFGKDLSEFDSKEVRKYLNSLNCVNIYTMLTFRSLLAKYSNYASSKENSFASLSVADLKSALSGDEKFLSRGNIEEIVNSLENSCDKAVILCAFSGIGSYGLREIIEITAGSICGNIIHLDSGRLLEIEDRLRAYIITACGTYQYFAPNGRTDYFLLDPNDPRILKGRTNTSGGDPIRRLRSRLEKVGELTGTMPMTFKRLQCSGFLDSVSRIARKNDLGKTD